MKQDAIKKEKHFNWWLIPAVICGLVAAFTIVLYVMTVNMTLVLAILPAIAGTGFSLYRMMGNVTGSKSKGISEAGPVVGDVNALVIFGRMDGDRHLADSIEFSKVEEKNLLGDKWFFEELNQWLHVVFNDLDNDGAMKAFELPDIAYTDPARLSIQLNMGRINDLFQTDPSLFDQLKPWILVAIIGIIGFLIFLSGSS